MISNFSFYNEKLLLLNLVKTFHIPRFLFADNLHDLVIQVQQCAGLRPEPSGSDP